MLLILFLFTLFVSHVSSKILVIESLAQINQATSNVFLFHSSLCSSTLKVLDVFETTHDKYFKDNTVLNFYKVDMSIAKIPETLFNLKAYPSIVLVDANKTQSKFDLDATPEDLRYFIEKNLVNNIPLYKNTKRLDDSFSSDYLTFIGDEQNFKNSYTIFKEKCFNHDDERIPCARLVNLDEKTRKNFHEAVMNQVALKQYVKKLLKQNNKETVVNFDNEFMMHLEDFKKNISGKINTTNFNQYEDAEMDAVLTNSSIFNEILLNSNSFLKNYEDYLSISENFTLDLSKEALIIYKNVQYGKTIFYYLTNQEQDFESKYTKFLDTYTHPNIYFRFTHRLRKYMTENESIGVVLFTKKRFYSSNFQIQYFVNQTHAMKTKIKYGDPYYSKGINFIDSCIFFIIDPEDNNMNKQLANFIGLQDDKIPAIYTFRFRKNKDFLEKSRFKSIESYYSSSLYNHIHAMHSNIFEGGIQMREASNDRDEYSQSLTILNSFSYEKLLETKINEKRLIVVEFSASYCRECLKLDAIVNKISTTLKSSNGYRAIYARLDVSENDFEKVPTNKIPLLRIYKTESQPKDYVEISNDFSEEKILKAIQDYTSSLVNIDL